MTILQARGPLNGKDKPAELEIDHRQLTVGMRSKMGLWFLRLVLKPLMARMIAKGPKAIARAQIQTASLRCKDTAGLSLAYDVVGGQVPGHVLGRLGGAGRVVLWIHGGAFIFPAAPTMHLVLVARLCRALDAVGFVPDYRLAPFNRFPAGLDDCERSYRALLDLGYDPAQIVLGGDSAGGTLALGLLQRIRRHGLPMPACSLLLSPVTELGRVHAPPSRHTRAGRDPLLPIAALSRIDELYAGGWDASDPELSPLYMDCQGLPPTLFMASDAEILLDDTLMLARRMKQAGNDVTCQVWPHYPHALPLFEPMFSELAAAREALVVYAQEYLGRTPS